MCGRGGQSARVGLGLEIIVLHSKKKKVEHFPNVSSFVD